MLGEDERKALFILNSIPGMYNKRLRLMYEYAGSFREAMKISEREYFDKGIFKRSKAPEMFRQKTDDPSFVEKSAENYSRLGERGIRMIDFTEKDMPGRLSSIPDPPLVIFLKGSLPDDSVPAVSIIGARACSEYGRSAAYFFGRELAKEGVQIVSGMALGIDSEASAGALSVSGKSFAVLGSGVEVCYPPSSRKIFDKMSGGQGGVISEFEPGAQALGYHFILRNRLISALGDVLMVIEARHKSGTSITVASALEQGKDVFALPGRITDPLGKGCNQLIKEGAFVLTCPEDVLSYLGIAREKAKNELEPKKAGSLSPANSRLLKELGPEPIHVEEAAKRSGIKVSEAVVGLHELEQEGYARSAGSAYYCLRYS